LRFYMINCDFAKRLTAFFKIAHFKIVILNRTF